MKNEEMANKILDYLGIHHQVVDGGHPITWGWCERCMQVGTLTKMLTEYTAPLRRVAEAADELLINGEASDTEDKLYYCGVDGNNLRVALNRVKE